MTTEELDALDALLRSTRFGPVEVVDVTEIWRISATREDVVCDCAESKDADFIAALVNAAPRLLTEARDAAILRAKLAEVEGKLREVTGQRDELREALSEMLKRHGSTCHRREFGADRCRYPCQSCDFDVRVRKALEAAR